MTAASSEQVPGRLSDERRCDHICLLADGHVGPHFYGYELPSPRAVPSTTGEVQP